MKVYVIPDENETRFQRIKREAKAKANQAWNWAKQNKEAAIAIATVTITAGTTLVKVVGKNINLHKQESVKNLYCYDRSLGHYWRLRRELSNAEWLEIDTRKKNGERLSDILSELKVLK